jgi:aspartate/methionine/tyrosine aminotransferase
VKVRPQPLSEFFNIGRDLGWDVKQQKWTVNQLIDPEGRSYTIGEIVEGGLPPDLPIIKSGNRYGYPPLRERVVASQEYNLPIDNVLMTMGTQLSLFLAFAVALEPGDEAIVETPSWEQPKVLCETLNVDGKLLRRRPELQWRFDLDELKSLVTPKTKLIYICHPNNPTGATLNDAELTAICDLARTVGAYVVSDEIYRGLEWSGELSPSVCNIYERGVTCASVSKTLGLSGTRIGWIATPDRDFMERCMELKYYMTLHQQSRLDETIAYHALEPEKYWGLVRGTMEAARPNFEAVSGWMETNRVFSWVPPAGGFLSFPHYDLDIPAWDLCIALLKEPYRTYLIPGSCYGYENHVRLGFGPGTKNENIRAGLAQIDHFIDDYQAGRVQVGER